MGGTPRCIVDGMILPKVRDPRLTTLRRGGSLTDTDHHLLALWAATCAEHVLFHFETQVPGDPRPRQAIELTRAWARGEAPLNDAKRGAWEANNAAREVSGAARFAALSAGQAAVVAHVAAHDLGAAAYAIRAAMAAGEAGSAQERGWRECRWQHDQLPEEIRELVLDDQRKRNEICWNVFLPDPQPPATQRQVVDYYSLYDEKSRLADEHSLERLRSQDILSRYLPAPRKILDIGGAAGVYSFWLADQGHDVSLVDLTPKHIDQATKENATRSRPLASIRWGDATKLSFPDSSFDLALLMGPLYHLLDRDLRVLAIREALRVLTDDGILIIAVISRYASMLDGFRFGLVNDEGFRQILDRDLATGTHLNNTGNPTYFTSAHLHLPEELRAEIEAAGGVTEALIAVEGMGSCIPEVEEKMKDPAYRRYLLEKLTETEREASLLGVSSHLMAIVRRRP